MLQDNRNDNSVEVVVCIHYEIVLCLFTNRSGLYFFIYIPARNAIHISADAAADATQQQEKFNQSQKKNKNIGEIVRQAEKQTHN